MTTENTDLDLKVHSLHYASELLVRVRLSKTYSCLIPCHRCEKSGNSHYLITQLDVCGFAPIYVVEMAQFVLKKNCPISYVRADFKTYRRSPSPIIAPGGILIGTAAVVLLYNTLLVIKVKLLSERMQFFSRENATTTI